MGACNGVKLPVNPPPKDCICGTYLVPTKNACLCGYIIYRCVRCKAVWIPDHKIGSTFRYSYELDLKLTKMVFDAEKGLSSLQIAKNAEEYNKDARRLSREQIGTEIKRITEDKTP
jgi:hypothetical protein